MGDAQPELTKILRKEHRRAGGGGRAPASSSVRAQTATTSKSCDEEDDAAAASASGAEALAGLMTSAPAKHGEDESQDGRGEVRQCWSTGRVRRDDEDLDHEID